MSDQAYIGRKPCGCAVACAIVDDGADDDEREATMRDLAWWRKGGLDVEPATVEALRATRFGCRCREDAGRAS